jgi:intraflagellar transport protein 74
MSGRIPTAYRVTASRQGTSMKATGLKPDGAVPNMPNVPVSNRPVTQQGLSGIKSSHQGYGRSVYDKSYYLGIVRQKITDLRNEIDNFDNEMQEIQRDTSTFKTLEKKRENLIKEVRNLEGELADYNLSLDKKRSDAHADEVLANFEYMKAQNQRSREFLDSLFLERKTIEEEIAKIEYEIASINALAEEKLTELDPEDRTAYNRLKEENRMLEDEIIQRKQSLEGVNQRLNMADARLRTDVMKQKANHLREQRLGLLRRKEDLEVQTNEDNLSFPEARERLMARAKADGGVIKETENRIKEVEKAISNYKKQIADLENDLKSSNDSSNKEKYELFYQKDKEMTEFIESFEPTRKAEMEMIKQAEDNITSLLERIAKLTDRRENLPSQEQVKEWESEYHFKIDKTGDSAVTLERLKAQLAERQADLEKTKELHVRIPQQLNKINEEITRKMNELATKYNNVDKMKDEYQELIKKLQKKKDSLTTKKETFITMTRNLNVKVDTKKQQMEDNKIAKELKDYEQKLAMNEQTIFSLKSYIDSKGVETNYQNLVQDCKGYIDMINSVLLSRYH